MESLEITDKSESNLLDQTASKIKTIDKGNEKILLIGNQNFKIPHSHEKTGKFFKNTNFLKFLRESQYNKQSLHKRQIDFLKI